MPRCIICGNFFFLSLPWSSTCSDECHEKLVTLLINQFGEFKKVVRQSTGVAYKVPTRDIIERGVSESELDRYPRWEE